MKTLAHLLNVHFKIKFLSSVCFQIGFKVFRVEADAEELTTQFFAYRRNDGFHKCLAKTPTWQDGRETNIRVRLPAAKYCIIPSTFLPGQEGDFILRYRIDNRWMGKIMKSQLM